MSYTNLELISHHLVAQFPNRERVHDLQLTLSLGEYVPFFGGAVEATSVVVKSLQVNDPDRQTVTLDPARTSIGLLPLVRGSVVVASDTSLGTVYVENLDYIIDYDLADLIIKDGGSLSPGQTVTVWSLPYQVYAEGAAYAVNTDRGEIKALIGGGIADGETVLVDYTPVYNAFDDEILANAVTMANSLVEREVDPDKQFGADPQLSAAATYRALEIICRTAAARELGFRGGAEKTARVWMQLAEAYAARSGVMLRAFHPPNRNPANPRRA